MSINVTLFDRKWPDTDELNARLRAIILEKEKEDAAGVSKSVRGGWHSGEDLFNWPYPEIKQFSTNITSGLPADSFEGRAGYNAWANVLRDGGYNKPHTHPGCTWSGVYYADVGQAMRVPMRGGSSSSIPARRLK